MNHWTISVFPLKDVSENGYKPIPFPRVTPLHLSDRASHNVPDMCLFPAGAPIAAPSGPQATHLRWTTQESWVTFTRFLSFTYYMRNEGYCPVLSCKIRFRHIMISNRKNNRRNDCYDSMSIYCSSMWNNIY